MAYQRKTTDRFKFTAEQLRRRRALLASGMKERELDIVRLHDVKRLTFSVIGLQYGFTGVRARQIYQQAFRKLFHPSRQAIWAGR